MYPKLFGLIAILLFTSCNSDPDDTGNTLPPESIVITDDSFTDSTGTSFFLGSSDCESNGSYFFDNENVYEINFSTDPLPKLFDLSELLPPVGNQLQQGSCTSWAVTYYLKSFQEHLQSNNPYDNTNLMSPAFSYNQLTMGNCNGTAISATLEILKTQGSSILELMPYNPNECATQPDEVIKNAAVINKISEYYYLDNNELTRQMKTLITEKQPIIIAAWLTDKFGIKDNFNLTAYRPHNVNFNEQGGCHAMLVVGYDDNFDAFKVVNSWGTDWGDDGFVWIDYSAFDNTSDPTADFRVISEALIATDL